MIKGSNLCKIYKDGATFCGIKYREKVIIERAIVILEQSNT